MSEEKEKSIRIEEIRALFVLGLLAVLASIRTQTINATVGQSSLPLNPIIDVTITLMSLYALFMVFGFSKDMVGETVADMFRSLALGILLINFIILVVYGFIIAIGFYQIRLFWMIVLISLPISFVVYRKYREKRKIRSKNGGKKLSPEDKLRVFGGTLSGVGVVISMLMVTIYSPEQFLWVFSALGVVLILVWLYFASKEPKSEKELLRSEKNTSVP